MSLPDAVGKALVAMLADCATWQSAVEAAGPEEARTQIMLGDGGLGYGLSVDGLTVDQALPQALVRVESLQSEQIALGCYTWSGDAVVQLVIPANRTLSPDADAARVAELAAIATELQDLVGSILTDTTSALLGAEFQASGAELDSEQEDNPSWRMDIACAWRQLP
jgi:hypothetical protein